MKSFYIDSHTHIYGEQFDEDRETALQRAFNQGIEYLLLPNVDVESIERVHTLSDQYPEKCIPMMGLHPCSVDQNFKDQLDVMRPLFDQRAYCAVGEIGIDLYWDKSTLELQQEAFRIQIEWAKSLQLPIVIHAREAFAEIFEVLDSCMDENLNGVFHCFTGNEKEAEKALSYPNFYLGIGGVVTYKTSTLPTVLAQVPLHRVLLETDAPYLPPVPYRGKRNESSYVLHVAEKLADIYQLPLAEIRSTTSEAAYQLFQLDKFLSK